MVALLLGLDTCTGLVFSAIRMGMRFLPEGELSWQRPSGEWEPITEAQARRRQWTSGFFELQWEQVADGLQLGVLPLARIWHQHTVVVARIDPARWRFRVAAQPGWSAEDVEHIAEAHALTLAINASYFYAGGPLGLVVSDGEVRQRQARGRAAHFVVEGGQPRIINQKRADIGDPEQGIQGFPSIMTDGVTYGYMRSGGRGFDVHRIERRSAVCTTRDRRVLLIATDTVLGGLSFSELATVLGGLGCDDAMGLDGGTSTGLYLADSAHPDAARYTIRNLKPVPVILGISPASAE